MSNVVNIAKEALVKISYICYLFLISVLIFVACAPAKRTIIYGTITSITIVFADMTIQTKADHALTGAVIGAILAGPVGAVIGAVIGKENEEKEIRSLPIRCIFSANVNGKNWRFVSTQYAQMHDLVLCLGIEPGDSIPITEWVSIKQKDGNKSNPDLSCPFNKYAWNCFQWDISVEH